MSSKLSRRSFIKKTGLAASMSFFITKDLIANGSPNEKVNVAIIGFGKQVMAHVNPLSSINECRIVDNGDVEFLYCHPYPCFEKQI